MEARGRGAGINKPAWLVQKEREEAAAAAASGGDNNVKVENGSENNTNGGTSSEIKTEKGDNNNTNGKFDDAPNLNQPPSSSYGGGGGYDERDQFGRNVERDYNRGNGGGSSRDYYDNRRGGDYRGGGGRRDYDDRRGGRDYDRRDDRRRGGVSLCQLYSVVVNMYFGWTSDVLERFLPPASRHCAAKEAWFISVIL